ncbi:MAG: protein translocase subunit SecD [Bdellovibrionales bacterium]|nr:protein translocase subunit SecD [Bdellovibrionales bacterium]
MIENIKARIAITSVVLLLGLAWVMPNFVNFEENQWWFTKEKIVYGLDIQGGLHLVLQANVNEVFAEKASRVAGSIKKDLSERGLELADLKVNPENANELVASYDSEQDLAKINDYLDEYYPNVLQVIDDSNGEVTIRFLDAYITQEKSRVVGQAIEVIRNRIDEFGVAEPSITSQGDNRILVQLPGIQNANRAKELINRTARLEFRIVDQEALTPEQLMGLVEKAEKQGGYELGQDGLSYSKYVERLNADLKDQLPENREILFEKAPSAKSMEAGKLPRLVTATSDFTGDQLEDAFVGQDEFGAPVVNFKVSVTGRKDLGDLTGNNVGKPMAIILDGVIKSAPVINSRISEGGMITLGSSNFQQTQEEAQFIATTLRAGALPAKLEQLEERTVGPTLGQDAIKKGTTAGIVGLVLVLVFMLVYYKSFGIVANIALALNMLLILAILSSLRATLTLPGVAGIVLTIGMAVDANVIIFERIKEELKKGASLKGSVKDGFGHAFSAIFDANITTAATCFVLIYFGTGPVRGFAVTLLCGIATSMFTAIFVSRTVFETLIDKFNVKKMSI